MRTQLAIIAAACVVAAPSASAHHAFSAEFDVAQPIKLEGTVKEWEMINPHSWFHIDVKGPDGKVVTWMIEGGSPNQLIRLGVTKNSVPTGTQLVVEGYRARDGTYKAVGRDFTFPDGRRLFLGGSAPGAAR
jgi:hypothetical protein